MGDMVCKDSARAVTGFFSRFDTVRMCRKVKKCQVRWLVKVERVAAAALSQEHFVCLTAQSWLPAPLGLYLSKWKGSYEIVCSQSRGTITPLVWYTYCILVYFSFQEGALCHDLTISVTDACVRLHCVRSENGWKDAGMHSYLFPPFYFFTHILSMV